MGAFNNALQIGLYQPENGNVIEAVVATLTAATEMAPATTDVSSAAANILGMAKKQVVLKSSFMNL